VKIELDDQILNHPKFIRAIAKGGSAVIHLWLGLRAYCSQHLTDGFVPDDMFTEVRGPTDSRSRNRATNCLAECNLLHRADGGWTLHDYLDHSSSREQVMAWRKANRDRKRQSRGVSHRDNECDNTSDGKCDGDRDTSVTTSGVPAPSYSLISGLDLGKKEDQKTREEPVVAKPRRDSFGASFVKTKPAATELFEAWRSESGKTGATMDGKRSEFYGRLALEGVTKEQVIEVVRGAKLDDWALNVAKLLDTTILGSASQREKYLELAKSPPKPTTSEPVPPCYVAEVPETPEQYAERVKRECAKSLAYMARATKLEEAERARIAAIRQRLATDGKAGQQ
jgi:hypothetical protein